MPEETSAAVLIRKARQRKRMTQRDLAEAVGVSTLSVWFWESGRHFPARRAGAVEEVLGIKLPAERQAS